VPAITKIPDKSARPDDHTALTAQLWACSPVRPTRPCTLVDVRPEQPAERLPRLSAGPASGQNRSAENGNAPAPLPLRRVPRRVAVSHVLPLVAPTHGSASEHAYPPYCCLPAPCCCLSVPCYEPTSTRPAVPWAPTPWGPPAPGGPSAPHETLAAWRACCKIRLK
jgi:hypothetical protein